MLILKRYKMNVLITGTSSGLGFALAKEYLDSGSTVFGISRRQNGKLKQYDEYFHMTHDLIQLDDLPDKLKEFLQNINILDLVILNAGAVPDTSEMRKTPVKEITGIMKVNVWANKVIIDTLADCVSAIYQVVAITSGSTIRNAKGLQTYSLSKSALNTLISFYAAEMSETHFTALAPGLIDSGLQEYISRLPYENNSAVIRKLKMMKKNGLLTNPKFAANYLVEAMGSVLQDESGLFRDVNEILFPETEGKDSLLKASGVQGSYLNQMAEYDRM